MPGNCSAEENASAVWVRLPSIVIDMDLSSLKVLEHYQGSIAAQGFFVHIGPVAEEHREDRLGLAKDMAGDLGVLVEGDTEAVVGTGLGQEGVVFVLDDIHSAYLRR